MAKQNLLQNERFWTIFLGSVGCIALLWNLYKDPSNWADFLVNLAQIGVAVIVFVVAWSTRERNKTIASLAKDALSSLQKQYPTFLLGPRYNRDNYDPETGKAPQYVFVTNEDQRSTLRAKFIPIDPLAEGVLTIYVQKGTLVYGLGYTSDEASLAAIKTIQQAVSQALTAHVQGYYAGRHEIIPTSKDDTAIIIDFNEDLMKKKHFVKAISDCSGLAVQTLLKFKHKSPDKE